MESALIIATGLLAGVLNTMAGGGSMIALPALIFTGLPANLANATNRPSILLGSLIACQQFHHKNSFSPSYNLKMVFFVAFGSIVGAFLSVDIEEIMLKKIIGSIMLLITIGFLSSPSNRFLFPRVKNKTKHHMFMHAIYHLLIGVYGGFLQVGVGFFIIFSATSFFGMNLVQAHAIKVLFTFILSIPAIFIFLYYDLIVWKYAILLTVGTIPGSYLGAQLATRISPSTAKILLILITSISAIKLLFF